MMKLPPAKILHVVIDEKQTTVWDRQITWWTPWAPYSKDLESRARQTAIDRYSIERCVPNLVEFIAR